MIDDSGFNGGIGKVVFAGGAETTGVLSGILTSVALHDASNNSPQTNATAPENLYLCNCFISDFQIRRLRVQLVREARIRRARDTRR